MLSMQGLERGTVGFSAALEIDVADVLYEQTEAPASPQLGSLAKRRNDFLNVKKQGVRPLGESDILMELLEIGESYHQPPPSQEKTSVELYTKLFTQVLFPPSRVTDLHDPYSLQVQIEALLDALATPNIWIDFSLVEWRIRVGQILWGVPYQAVYLIRLMTETRQQLVLRWMTMDYLATKSHGFCSRYCSHANS
jgi:hypothetical protein